jgi:hypothetical protein
MIRCLRRGAALLVLGLLALASGCGKDSNPVAPRDAPGPTLQNLWPNADGRGWVYRVVQRGWTDTSFHYYPTEAEVPPAPDMLTLSILAGLQPVGPGLVADTSRYTLRFAGTATNHLAVTGQNLTGSMTDDAAAVVSPAGAARARLARARPDLAARLGSAAAARGPRSLAPSLADFPVFLHGGLWKRDSLWVGTYSDLDTAPSFHFLRADLSPGAAFSMPMYPGLAPEVMLHALVLSRSDVRVQAGRFANAFVVLYLIDYGVGHSPQGYWRELDYGTIAYAPDTGPVWSYERINVNAGSPLAIGAGDATLELTGTLR